MAKEEVNLQLPSWLLPVLQVGTEALKSTSSGAEGLSKGWDSFLKLVASGDSKIVKSVLEESRNAVAEAPESTGKGSIVGGLLLSVSRRLLPPLVGDFLGLTAGPIVGLLFSRFKGRIADQVVLNRSAVLFSGLGWLTILLPALLSLLCTRYVITVIHTVKPVENLVESLTNDEKLLIKSSLSEQFTSANKVVKSVNSLAEHESDKLIIVRYYLGCFLLPYNRILFLSGNFLVFVSLFNLFNYSGILLLALFLGKLKRR